MTALNLQLMQKLSKSAMPQSSTLALRVIAICVVSGVAD
jgi:hypothetical protein